MQTTFSLAIGRYNLDFINMNVARVQLLQMFVEIDGVRKRYHLQLSNGRLRFTLPEDIPGSLQEMEHEISEAVFNFYNTAQ